MDEEQLNRISKAVREFLGANRGLRMVRSAEVTSLVEYVCQRVTGVEEVPLHVASLMCALGPGRGAPPVSMLREVSEIVTREVGGDLERIKEVVIAYGCGKWRCLRVSTDPWDDQWQGAFLALDEGLVPYVREVNMWLSPQGVDHGEAPDQRCTQEDRKEWEDNIRSDAGYIAVNLTQPVKPLHVAKSGELLIVSEDDGVRIQLSGEDDGDWLPFGAKAVFEIPTAATFRVRREGTAEKRHMLHAGTRVNVLATESGTKVRLTWPSRKEVREILETGDASAISGTVAIAHRACACGHRDCAADHRLDSWDPKRIVEDEKGKKVKLTLWSFLASAVKGRSAEIMAKALAAGMYLPFQAKDGTGRGPRWRIVEVEYKHCPNPDCPSPVPGRKYDGDRCPHPGCKRAFDPRTTLRHAYERWIVVGGGVPRYERVARYHCTASVKRNGRDEHCGNLYESEKCPICNAKKTTRRPKIVWARTHYTSGPYDDEVDSLPASPEDDPSGESDGGSGRRARKTRAGRKRGKRS